MKTRRLICPDFRRIEVEEDELEGLGDDGILVRNEYTAVSVGMKIHNWLHGCEPGREPRFPRVTGPAMPESLGTWAIFVWKIGKVAAGCLEQGGGAVLRASARGRGAPAIMSRSIE